MAGYCTNSQIEELFRGRMGVAQSVFAADTQVTSADVANCITRWASYMDAHLAQVYTVPVSTGATADTAMRQTMNGWFAAAEILVKLRGGARPAQPVLGMPADEAAKWREDAERMLTMVVSANPPLWGTATLASEKQLNISHLISAPLTDEAGDTWESQFTIGEERADGDTGLRW